MLALHGSRRPASAPLEGSGKAGDSSHSLATDSARVLVAAENFDFGDSSTHGLPQLIERLTVLGSSGRSTAALRFKTVSTLDAGISLGCPARLMTNCTRSRSIPRRSMNSSKRDVLLTAAKSSLDTIK